MKKITNTFENIYKHKPDFTSFTPYRICPLGAHVDHQFGKVTGFAIDKGILFAYSPKQNGVVEVISLQFNKRAQWHIASVPEQKQNDWADYLRGITLILGSRYKLKYGICGIFDGQFPIGGLSSSAAVSISFLKALCSVNDIKLTEKEIIDISKESENKYVGVSCGKLDQSCITYCQKDKLLFLDTKDDSYVNIQAGKNMKPYKLAIFFSGLERSLASSKFNLRVDETKSAAYCLKAFAGIDYGKYDETHLREISPEIFGKYKHLLPDNFRKRAEHYFSEQARVEKGARLWAEGNVEEFGKLVTESGNSSIVNYEAGSNELKTLYEILVNTKGVYGARFSGAGFKGCCMAIINPEYQDEILSTVKERYLKVFPELKDKYVASVCSPVDGVGK